MSVHPRALVAVFSCLLSGWAAAEQPPFKLIRFDEDYTYLAGNSREAGIDDRLKYIRFGGSGYLSLGGEWRERFESLDAARFGIGTVADQYVLQRLLLHADLHVNERVRIFAQVGRADAFGKSAPLTPSDAGGID